MNFHSLHTHDAEFLFIPLMSLNKKNAFLFKEMRTIVEDNKHMSSLTNLSLVEEDS